MKNETTIVWHLGCPKRNINQLTVSLRKDAELLRERKVMLRRPRHHGSTIFDFMMEFEIGDFGVTRSQELLTTLCGNRDMDRLLLSDGAYLRFVEDIFPQHSIFRWVFERALQLQRVFPKTRLSFFSEICCPSMLFGEVEHLLEDGEAQELVDAAALHDSNAVEKVGDMEHGTKLVVSTMKDEGPYLLEWLAYHRAIGFTDFLIYTNDCSDGTDLLLDRLQNAGFVIHVRNKVLKRGPHKSALKYAQAHAAYRDADWVYVCDVDEFLNIKAGDGHVDDLIAQYPDADAIPVAWRLFSNNGHQELLPGMMSEKFVDAEPEAPQEGELGRFVKTLFRTSSQPERLGLHGPVYMDENDASIKWAAPWLKADPNADPRRPQADFGYEVAQVNHYAVRSIDAFLIKRHRGRANHVHETLGLDYWHRWCQGGETDRSIQRKSAAMQKEYDALVADPIVAHLHQGACEYQKKKLAELLLDPDIECLRGALVERAGRPQPSTTVSPETEALRVKAPKRHQNRLKMLEQMPKGGRCAEIGVWNGGFSGAILEVTMPRELTLIDPWELLSGQDEGEWTHKRHQNHEFMRGMFDNVSATYGALPNVSIRKGFSAEVLETFPDGYFDWLYIDGNHLYEFVRKDLDLSFRKVRPGGIIAGDDFYWKRDGRNHVKEAVLDSMRAHGMSNQPSRIGQQFMITVPECVAEAN